MLGLFISSSRLLDNFARVSWSKITVILLGIFDLDVSCTLLKTRTVGLFALACGDFLEDLKCVRVQRLHRATCLVAEVQCAFVGPLWLTGYATREAESFAFGIYYRQTTKTTICHGVKSLLPFQDPSRLSRRRVHLPTSSTPRGDLRALDFRRVVQFLYLVL